MARKTSSITLRVQNKNCNSKHNFPKELGLVTERIEKLNFVTEPLGKARWTNITSKYKQKIDIAGFDDLQRSFSINIYGKAYKQKFYVKVDIPKDKCLLESKCLKIGIPVKEMQEDSYYYDKLKDFYEKEIIKVVEDFYKE
jgi:hypothetical protein